MENKEYLLHGLDPIPILKNSGQQNIVE